jgi:hypothetical protein
MKSRLMTVAGALALLAVIGKFYAAPVIAQTIRAALVKNIDERGRNPYVVESSCQPIGSASSGFCLAQGYPVVPAGMRLVVENVNLFAIIPSPAAIVARTGIYVNTSLNRVHEVTGGTYTANAPSGRLYALNQNLVDYIEAGEKPSLLINIGGDPTGSVMFATITGYLVNLSN